MSAASRGYVNFMIDKGNDFSIWLWVSRELKPQIANKQITRRTPEYHKVEVLNSPKIQFILDKLSEEQNVPKEELIKQAKIILDEIGYCKNLKLLRWLAFFLAKICGKILTGAYANAAKIEHIKSLMPNCPVMFVPSHRSYADFILMSALCFSFDIEIPAIAAGMDFHGMFAMGTMLRNTGAFFMRRSYNNDNLYWATFRQYIDQLVTKGDLPIEFFIEGTRSRSGKSLVPKYGLMNMILKSFFLSEVPDILFVPISISYERVLEERLFAYELLGVPKPKESTSGFFKSLKILRENFGNIYFHLSDPISAKEVLGKNLDRSVHSIKPLHFQQLTENEKKQIPKLAHEIIHKQQKSSVITAFNLLATILYNNLANRHVLLTLQEITEEVLWLKQIFEKFGAFVHIENIDASIKDAFVVHKDLITIKNDGRVDLVRDNVVIDRANLSKMKAHSLSDKTMTYSVPLVMLQLYVNSGLHFFIDVAFLTLILTCKSCCRDELLQSFHFLKTTFLWEFVSFGPREKMEFENALSKAIELNLIESDSNCFRTGPNAKLGILFCTILQPFVYSYYVVSSVVETVSDLCDEKTILVKVQKILENKISGGENFIHPYCLTLDTITNCLNSLSTNHILEKLNRDGKAFYNIKKDQISLIKLELETYVSRNLIAQEMGSELPHLSNKL